MKKEATEEFIDMVSSAQKLLTQYTVNSKDNESVSVSDEELKNTAKKFKEHCEAFLDACEKDTP